MTSLFAGSPQQAPSYAATTSDVPKWLQDYTVDLFSQQRAVSATPYQPYALPRIAGTTAPTTAAQNLITSSSGAYQPAMSNAIAGTQGLTSQQAGTTAGLGYLQQAAGMSGSAAAAPLFGQATNMATQAGGTNTATPLNMMQGQYTNPNLATQNLNLGQNALAQSGQTATSNIGAYMNPYTQNVTDQIATLGARNLSENLLPAVSDQFIRAGQFGSSGMGTFGGRALRDTQEAILNQQNQALQAGYGQALNASQADLARQAQLGQTYTQAGQAQQATGIGAAQAVAQQQATDAARQMAAAQELGTIGQQTGALTQAGQQNLGTIGAQTAATAQAEAQRQAAAQQQVADLAKMQQGLTTADAAALESVGTAQQQQAQRGLDVAYQDYQNQINYPQTQINNMSTTLRGLPPTAVPTTGTQTGYTTTFAPSPLSGIAAAYATYKGLTSAKGGLIRGYADGGAVTPDPNAQSMSDLEKSVMADYGRYHYKTVDIPQRPINPTASPDMSSQLADLNAKYYSQPVTMSHGGGVPGYAEEGYVDAENPAPLVPDYNAQPIPVAPNYNAQPAQQIEPSGGGAVPMPAALSNMNPEFASLIAQYGQGADYSKEIAANTAARKEQDVKFNTAIEALKKTAPDTPSQSEMWFKLAAAFADPGKTGSFLEGMGHAAGVMGEHRAETRKGIATQNKINTELDLKQQQYALENLRDEGTQLRTLQGEASKDKREMIKAAIKDYVDSGKPQSEAGKIALDEGLKRGTPEYEARVTTITKQKLDNQMGVLAATLGSLNLNQQKFQQEQIKLEPDERASIRTDEDAIHAAKAVVKNLAEALQLNKIAFTNTPADRAIYNKLKTTNPNDPRVKATEDLENLVGLNTIGSLKSTFGSNPTEGERAALKELGGLGTANREIRAKIFERSAAALSEAIDYRDARIKKIESGGYRKTPATAGKKE